MDQVVFYVGL